VKRALTTGSLIAVSCAVGATLWFLGSTFADGVTLVHSYDDHCSEPSDVVFPRGSCAPPLTAKDFAAGRATLTLTIERTDSGTRLIDYTYENRTSRYRSVDWSMVEMTTPTGVRVPCPGDDSTQRYPAPPSTARESGYACAEIGPPGRYRAAYGGVVVAHLDITE